MRQSALLLLLLSVTLSGQFRNTPERTVEQNVISSDQSPAVRIELPLDARYLGADRWILYGVADCELHVWIEAGQDKVVNRLYWVQFEAFMHDKPQSRYNYPFTRTKIINGWTFDVRARFGATTPPKPDSDAGHVWKIIEAAGYKAPKDMMNVRFVHLPDEQKRTELMIIYAEELKPTGLTAADLEPGGKANHRWAALEEGLIERGAQRLKISKRSSR
jgi:hypothetical protein